MTDSSSALRFPYLLFDLGSTLIYFEGNMNAVMAEALRQATRALREMGYHVDEQVFPEAYNALIQTYYQKRNDTFLEFTAGYVLEEALRAGGVTGLPEKDLLHALRVLYSVTQDYWHVEQDAAPTLQTLRASGYRMGIISNAADDEDVQTLVDRANLRGYFDFILSSARAGFRKPRPEIFQQALAHWGARPNQAVMIGDIVSADVVGATNLGMASVWIKRRNDSAENRELIKQFPPGAIISALNELPGALENLP